MALKKRESKIAKDAGDRAAKLNSIDPALDLGNGLTLASFKADISSVSEMNDAYNTQKAKLDGMLDHLQAAERALRTKHSAMLASTRVKFGEDSPEYEQAGGTRKSEYRKRARKGESKAAKTAAAKA